MAAIVVMVKTMYLNILIDLNFSYIAKLYRNLVIILFRAEKNAVKRAKKLFLETAAGFW